MLVKNENYEVIVVPDPKTAGQLTYGVHNLKTGVTEIHSMSIVYCNVYAVESNKQINKQVWNQDIADDLAELMEAMKSPKGGKAN
jgi:hypothetical protein